ncbi:MAG TPA: hypothetical protein VMC61_04470 [Methanocella sp.]|nr:hypothetical protein [Methanocella sp.]
MRALPLIVSMCALALLVAPALAADVTIPVNKDFTSGDMVIHVTKVMITDKYWGNTYSADPDNTIWPKVWFVYENKGTVPVNGNLYVSFVDDKGNKYWDARSNRPIADITMNPIEPGKTSDERFIEAAAPRGTKITKVILSHDGFRDDMVIDIPGGSSTSATETVPTTGGGSSICPSILLPLLLLGAVAMLRKKR